VGKWREDGKFSEVKVDFQEKIHEPPYIIFCMVIKAQEDCTLHGDTVIMIAPDTIPYIV